MYDTVGTELLIDVTTIAYTDLGIYCGNTQRGYSSPFGFESLSVSWLTEYTERSVMIGISDVTQIDWTPGSMSTLLYNIKLKDYTDVKVSIDFFLQPDFEPIEGFEVASMDLGSSTFIELA